MSSIVFRRPLETALLAIWAGYFALLAAFRFESAYDHTALAIAYQVAFVVGVVAVFAMLPAPRKARTSIGDVKTMAYVGLGLSVLGLSALVYSKTRSGIDYSQSLCLARYQMARLGHHPTPLSVLGNLFSFAFFVPLVVTIVSDVGRRTFWSVLLGCFACLMALTFIMSSRSSMMLFIAFAIAAAIVRLAIGRPIPRPRLIDAAFLLVAGLLALGYVSAVFSCRAAAGNMTSAEYVADFAPHLGIGKEASEDAPGTSVGKRDAEPAPGEPAGRPAPGEPVGKPASEPAPGESAGKRAKEASPEGTSMTRAPGALAMVVLYIVHSTYTFDGVLTLGHKGGHVNLYYAAELAARLGLVQPPGQWVLAGRFLSLPGSLYHDLGPWGLLVGTLATALVAWAALNLAARFSGSALVAGAAAAVISILVLSPIHPAAEFMAFPFICVLFVVVPAIARLLASLFGLRREPGGSRGAHRAA